MATRDELLAMTHERLQTSPRKEWLDILQDMAQAIERLPRAGSTKLVCVDCQRPNERCSVCAAKNAAGRGAQALVQKGVQRAADGVSDFLARAFNPPPPTD